MFQYMNVTGNVQKGEIACSSVGDLLFEEDRGYVCCLMYAHQSFRLPVSS